MKRFLLFLIRATGVLWLWRFAHRREVLILTVHGVMDDHEGQQWRPLRHRLSPDRLDATLRMLKKCYTFVSLDDAVAMLAGRRPVQPYSAVLTFDDGYRNQVTHALPVLRRHGVPAVIFAPTGIVESRRPFWFDRLDFALQSGDVHGREVSIGSARIRLQSRTRQQLAQSFAELRETAKSLVRDDREMCSELEALAAALEAESGRALATFVDDDPWSAVLTIGEIRSTAAVSFGSHTVDHLRLHRLDRYTLLEQLQQSKRSLEAWTGRPCRYFCYPDGGVSAEASAAVKLCGYDAAVTTARGRNRIGDDLTMLRRVDVPAAGSPTELVAGVSGLLDALVHARNRLRPERAVPGGRSSNVGRKAAATSR